MVKSERLVQINIRVPEPMLKELDKAFSQFTKQHGFTPKRIEFRLLLLKEGLKVFQQQQ